MNVAYFQEMLDYNRWANHRVWDCVAGLTDEQFNRTSDYSIGSVHAQVVHTMAVEWLFFQRVNGTSPTHLPDPSEYPKRDVIRSTWDSIESDWQTYLASLQDADVDRTIAFNSFNGGPRQQPLWELLAHLFNHSTDHRSQTLALIHQLGGQTVQQDFLFYTWVRAGLEEV
jgi:uncharacterized damage-inducible protein DinB